jgi:soluble lytic murein transglycosylase
MLVRRILPFAAALLAASAAWSLPPGLTRRGAAIAMQPISDHAPTANTRAGRPAVLSASDFAIFSRAFQAADQGNWTDARALAAQSQNGVAKQLLQWRYLLDRNSGATFAEIDAFLKQDTGWPLRNSLLARAEAAITPDMTPAAVLAWCGTRPPAPPIGNIRLGEALAATGDSARAGALIRRGWIDGQFDLATEQAIVERDGAFLTPASYRARVDHLLWAGALVTAKRQLARLPPRDRAVAAARIALQEGLAKARKPLAEVAHSNDPGLLFDHARAARLAGDQDTALALLQRIEAQGAITDHPKPWWAEVNVQARDALKAGKAQTAYTLVTHAAITSGVPFAESQFLAGFIALRFLKEPRTALRHFEKLRADVSRPISVARGYYWEGRSYEALGEPALAIARYRRAAREPETFYGQLALARIEPAPVLRLKRTPVLASPAPAQDADPLIVPMQVLDDLGQTVYLRIFATADSAQNPAPGHRRLLMQKLTDWGFRDVALRLAKAASYEGIFLPAYTHPIIALPPYNGPGTAPDPAMVLGLIRQETEFNPAAISHAGARGIMQLMDVTAQRAARIAGIPYRPDALLSDVPYNIQLGMVDFANNLAHWNGSLVLAEASYNGGSGNVRKWLAANGDPRTGDPIDWIEQIPFSETRNYVMRVLENVEVYRSRLAGGEAPLRILTDLYAPAAPPTDVLSAPAMAKPSPRPPSPASSR